MQTKDIIKSRREALNLTMKELSVKVGVSEATISRWESGEIANMRRSAISSLAKALAIKPSTLMGWDDAEPILPIAPSFEYYDIPAGIAAGALEEINGMEDIPKVIIPDVWLGKYARNRDLVFMHVNGESMNKIIQNGATIAVLTKVELDNIHNGDIVIAATCHGEYTIKHFYDDADNKRFILRPNSTDPSFMDMSFKYIEADDMCIFGKVVIYSVYL